MIYTKTGDQGQTSLYGGKRVSKADLLIESYGSIDELQSLLGLTINKLSNRKDKQFFVGIEKDLYQIMSILAGASRYQIKQSAIKKLEKYIDQAEASLPKLNKFIILSKSEISCLFNVCRTVCRRSERNVVHYFNNKPLTSNFQLPTIIKYLNRLSDLFFIASRVYNRE